MRKTSYFLEETDHLDLVDPYGSRQEGKKEEKSYTNRLLSFVKPDIYTYRRISQTSSVRRVALCR